MNNSGLAKTGQVIHIMHLFEKELLAVVEVFTRLLDPMPTIRRPRLLKTDVLRAMNSSNLVSLLNPFTDYLAGHGIQLKDVGQDGYDFNELAAVLACPSEATPPDLVEKLEMLDLISDGQSTLNFEDEYQELVSRLIEEGDTTADIAVKILLTRPEVAYREFDRQALQAKRSLVSYRVRQGLPFLGVDKRKLDHFCSLVAPWFEKHARSGVCYIHHREEPTGIAFVIRHGDLLKRIGVLNEQGDQESCILRPERVDVAHYNIITGEWQISGLGTKLQDLYREAFGAVFHGSKNALLHSNRYSLEPLREGVNSLICDPTAVVQYAELKSVRIEVASGSMIEIKSHHVFDTFTANPEWVRFARIVDATISLKCENRKRRVQLKICPDRDTITGNASDPAVDAWLNEKGFAHNDGQLLASA